MLARDAPLRLQVIEYVKKRDELLIPFEANDFTPYTPTARLPMTRTTLAPPEALAAESVPLPSLQPAGREIGEEAGNVSPIAEFQVSSSSKKLGPLSCSSSQGDGKNARRKRDVVQKNVSDDEEIFDTNNSSKKMLSPEEEVENSQHWPSGRSGGAAPSFPFQGTGLGTRISSPPPSPSSTPGFAASDEKGDGEDDGEANSDGGSYDDDDYEGFGFTQVEDGGTAADSPSVSSTTVPPTADTTFNPASTGAAAKSGSGQEMDSVPRSSAAAAIAVAAAVAAAAGGDGGGGSTTAAAVTPVAHSEGEKVSCVIGGSDGGGISTKESNDSEEGLSGKEGMRDVLEVHRDYNEGGDADSEDPSGGEGRGVDSEDYGGYKYGGDGDEDGLEEEGGEKEGGGNGDSVVEDERRGLQVLSSSVLTRRRASRLSPKQQAKLPSVSAAWFFMKHEKGFEYTGKYYEVISPEGDVVMDQTDVRKQADRSNRSSSSVFTISCLAYMLFIPCSLSRSVTAYEYLFISNYPCYFAVPGAHITPPPPFLSNAAPA